ncbi:MAG: hypothetical protein KIT84_40515 [Labilithrix sp.]|nr:hypothetical protein [Labilithrix sp.]MCW5817352.1 hypothetical protein [Labilithrix sp.]
MSPDQVDDAGWSPEDWSSFNELATATVEEHAQLRKIIPEGPSAPNAYLVELPVVAPGARGFHFNVPDTRKVTRVRVPFVITAEQLHDTANIRALIEHVARELALWEDRLLAFGPAAAGPGSIPPAGGAPALPNPPNDIKIENDPRTVGLLSGQGLTGNGADVLDRMKQGVRSVRRRLHTKTLSAAVGFDAYMTLVQDPNRRLGLDRARDVLGSKDAALASVPPDDPACGRDEKLAVFTPDPGVLDLVWAQRPRISFVGTDNGDLKLRLEEAFLLRIKNSSAIAVVDP